MSKFKDERSKVGAESTRYGKDIIQHFNVNEDLVFWEMKEEWTENGYLVTLIHPEVAALCPVSGYPDSGKITVKFIPNDHTVELKAFKLWINSYRDKAISHEGLANEIFNTLLKSMQPQTLYVKLEMQPRGNVTTVVEVNGGIG